MNPINPTLVRQVDEFIRLKHQLFGEGSIPSPENLKKLERYNQLMDVMYPETKFKNANPLVYK